MNRREFIKTCGVTLAGGASVLAVPITKGCVIKKSPFIELSNGSTIEFTFDRTFESSGTMKIFVGDGRTLTEITQSDMYDLIESDHYNMIDSSIVNDKVKKRYIQLAPSTRKDNGHR